MVTRDTDQMSECPDPPDKTNRGLLLWPRLSWNTLSIQHLDEAHLWGGMDFLSKGEVLTVTDLEISEQ